MRVVMSGNAASCAARVRPAGPQPTMRTSICAGSRSVVPSAWCRASASEMCGSPGRNPLRWNCIVLRPPVMEQSGTCDCHCDRELACMETIWRSGAARCRSEPACPSTVAARLPATAAPASMRGFRLQQRQNGTQPIRRHAASRGQPACRRGFAGQAQCGGASLFLSGGAVHAVVDQIVDDARVGQGRDVAQLAGLVLRDFPEDAAHDLAGAGLRQVRRPLQAGRARRSG